MSLVFHEGEIIRESTVRVIQPKLLWHLLPVLLAACVPATLTPTVAVMPAPGKPLEIFAAEQTACKQFAEQQILAARNQLSNQILGAALAPNASDPLASGQAAAQAGTPVLQQQYDTAYSQCMYAKGNQVPGYQVASPAPPQRLRHQRIRHTPQGEAAATQKFVEPSPSAQPVTEPITEPPPVKR